MTGFNNSSSLESPDYTGYFFGRVVDNNDPSRRQRIKVVVPELLEGVPDLLPWVGPVLHSPFGITASAGVVNVPEVGSLVVVEFQKGQLAYGLSVGFMPTAAFTPPAELLVNYPKRRGWKDPSGNIFWVDNTVGSVEVHFEHTSGASIHIANDGTVTVDSPTKVIVNATDEINFNTPLAKFSGDVEVLGTIDAGGDITTPADVVAGTISLKTHAHSGIKNGPDISDPPIP